MHPERGRRRVTASRVGSSSQRSLTESTCLLPNVTLTASRVGRYRGRVRGWRRSRSELSRSGRRVWGRRRSRSELSRSGRQVRGRRRSRSELSRSGRRVRGRRRSRSELSRSGRRVWGWRRSLREWLARQGSGGFATPVSLIGGRLEIGCPRAGCAEFRCVTSASPRLDEQPMQSCNAALIGCVTAQSRCAL